ncbi:MAG: hydantoinase/oxoprolinase family protein [Promethearchaeota archaeon]
MNEILIGLDVGGVNIKCASILKKEGDPLDADAIYSTKRHYPLWENSRAGLEGELRDVLQEHVSWHEKSMRRETIKSIHVAASITGELSDAYASKREGIIEITAAMEAATKHAGEQCECSVRGPLFVSTGGTLLNREDAMQNHRLVSAANWYATATWLGAIDGCINNGLLVDIGSTTTDIIPIIQGIVHPFGRTDFDRLESGELLYTGVLRPTIPSISHAVPVRNAMIPVSFEKFALMADVHLLLGYISQAEYDCETADGRDKSPGNCEKRLARMVCEDAEVLGNDAVMEIARYLHRAQVKRIRESIEKVLARVEVEHGIGRNLLSICFTGLGEHLLDERTIDSLGIQNRSFLSDNLGFQSSITSSALGVVFMLHQRVKMNLG